MRLSLPTSARPRPNRLARLVLHPLLALLLAALLLPAAGHAVAIPAALSNHAPGIAAFNGLIHVVYIRYPDNRLVYQTTTGGSTWSGEILVPLGTTPKSKVSAAVYNNRLWVFYSTASGSGLRFRTLDLGGAWSAESVVLGASTDDGPGLAVFNNLLHVFWETAGSGSDRIRTCTFNTANAQSGVSLVPFGLTYRGPTAAVFGNRLYLAYTGTGGAVESGKNIYYGFMDANGFWVGDSRPPGDPRTSTGPTLAPFGADLWLVYLPKSVHESDQIHHKRLNTLGQWTAEAVVVPISKSETGVSATVFNNRLWLAGGMGDASPEPRSVQYHILQ